MKKIAKVKSWVPPVHVIRERVHGAGSLKKMEPKKGLGFFAKSQTKAHILRDKLVSAGDEVEEVLLEQKGTEVAGDSDSNYDSDCADKKGSTRNLETCSEYERLLCTKECSFT